MTNHDRKQEDWVIPTILVLVIVFVAAIIGIVVGVRAASSDDSSPTGQAERWSKCLRSEGANVPLVEATGDGGFRITVDGSLLEGDVDRDVWANAFAACTDEAPDRIRDFMDRFGRFSELPFLEGEMLDA